MSQHPLTIGGYFSLELPLHKEYHAHAVNLNTGRNCLELILSYRHYDKVYLPYYSCDVLLEPFLKLGVEYTFYHINERLEINEEIRLGQKEALLYVNYFGLKHSYVKHLADIYGRRLIVDNTQAFFEKPLSGIDTFYSCRKFFGVPDGAYLYTDAEISPELERDVSYERMAFLTKRIDLGAEAGYHDFRTESHNLVGQPVKKMSKLTKRLMQSIDYQVVKDKRKANYLFLEQHLNASNSMNMALELDAVPMVYPYYCQDDSLRKYLISQKIFVAQYWPDVLQRTNEESIETRLTMCLLPLPIDQRNDINEMKQIIQKIRIYAKRENNLS